MDAIDKILVEAMTKPDGEYVFRNGKLVPHTTQTDLEKILSNIVHVPVKLIDFRNSANYSDHDGSTYEFGMTAVPMQKGYIPDDEIPFCDPDCEECDMYNEEVEFDAMWGVPDVERIIFNPPATIVFWADGTKTVVKCIEGEKFEKYAGFAAACMKKMFGSTSRAKAIMTECDDEVLNPPKEYKPKHEPKQPERKQKTIDFAELVNAFVASIKQAAEAKEKKDETPSE